MRAVHMFACFALMPMMPVAGLAASGNYADLVNREVLRVCAISSNMPYSNEQGDGFDNKIADLIAGDLHVPVSYTWYPGGYGLIRNTLMAKRCDMVMGTIQEDSMTMNTKPYYRSTYALIFRKDSGLDGVRSLSDPRLKNKRLSNQGGPIGNFIAANGLLVSAKSYLMAVDRRYNDPERDIVNDVLSGQIDVGVLWGPTQATRRADFMTFLTLFQSSKSTRATPRSNTGSVSEFDPPTARGSGNLMKLLRSIRPKSTRYCSTTMFRLSTNRTN